MTAKDFAQNLIVFQDEEVGLAAGRRAARERSGRRPAHAAPAAPGRGPAIGWWPPQRAVGAAGAARARLRQALEERVIALTIAPGDKKAQDAHAAAGGRIGPEIAGLLQEGRTLLDRGLLGEAQQRFLTALQPRSHEPDGVRDAPERGARGDVHHAHRPGRRNVRVTRRALLRRSASLRGHRRDESSALNASLKPDRRSGSRKSREFRFACADPTPSRWTCTGGGRRRPSRRPRRAFTAWPSICDHPNTRGHPEMIQCCGRTDVGRRRARNEDSILVGDGILVVCDGMGGHQAGDVASQIGSTRSRPSSADRGRSRAHLALRIRSGASFDANRIRTAIKLANRAIFTRAAAEDEYAGMGTTVAAILAGRADETAVHLRPRRRQPHLPHPARADPPAHP